MDKDAYLEINASQRPALALLDAMGYTYISPADCDKQLRSDTDHTRRTGRTVHPDSGNGWYGWH